MKQIEENSETFLCSICYLPFTNNNPALMLKCSHTFCKICVDKYIKEKKNKCLICQNEGSNLLNKNEENENSNIFCENKIINDLMELWTLFNIDIDAFLSFPINFKYCENCNYFITNYSFNFHKSSKHKLLNFDKKLKSFLDSKNIFEDKNKFIFFLLYYYQSPFLGKFKFIDIKKKISFSNGDFLFYGQFMNSNESSFIFKLYEDNKNNINTDKWHKGIMFNKNSELIIHGYFCFRYKDSNIFLIHKIFGLLNHKSIKFFGFIKNKKEIINEKEKLDINDFIFDCGLLYDNNEYYFGEFAENEVTNYFTKKKIDKNDNIRKLIKGEIIIKEEKGVNIINTFIPLKVVNKKETIIENIETKEINGNLIFKEKNSKQSINIIPLNKTKENNIDNLSLSECKINISKNNKVLRFNSDNEDSIIFLNPFRGIIKQNSLSEEGFLIKFKDNELVIKLNSLKSLTIKKIKEDKNNFFEFINNKLFEVKIQNCMIRYYIFEINNNSIIKADEKYFEIYPEYVKIINRRSKRNKEKIYNYNFLKNNLEELFEEKLNNILEFSDRNEDTPIYC